LYVIIISMRSTFVYIVFYRTRKRNNKWSDFWRESTAGDPVLVLFSLNSHLKSMCNCRQKKKKKKKKFTF
jgi:hypothetical protein